MPADLQRVQRPKATFKLQTLLMVMAAVGLLGMLIVSFLLLGSLGTNLEQQKQLSLRGRVEMAESLVRHFHERASRGELSEAAAQALAIQALRQIRSGKDNYVWINDTHSRLIQHPFMPELENQDISHLKDHDGKPLLLNFIDIAVKQGAGFAVYSWPKPHARAPSPKLSYVKLFAPWQWVIGSGEYLDDIHDAYWNEVWRLVPILLGTVLLFVAMIFWLRRQVLVRVGSEMKDAVTIATRISRNELSTPIKLDDSARSGLLDLLAGGTNRLGRILARRKRAEDERRRLSEALKQSHEPIILVEADLSFAYVNPAFTRLFGYPLEELAGQSIDLLEVVDPSGKTQDDTPSDTLRTARQSGIFRGEVLRRAKDGRAIPILIKVAPVLDEYEIVTGYVATMTDLTERKQAEDAARRRLDEITRINAELKQVNERLTQSRNQLQQSEKMASIGILAAGVAHEINNPVGFIHSNMGALRRYVTDFLRLIDAYQQAVATPEQRASCAGVQRLAQEIEFAYEREDVLVLLDESVQGLERVTKIVKDLKDFSRIDQNEQWQQADIHPGLESTLNIARSEFKDKCEIRREFGELPTIECLPNQLNQVFMNLLVNAAHAIDQHGIITLRTGSRDGRIWIEVSDTGRGIAPEHLKQIFDPFFTTKTVGQGTGLGLAVSYGIIEKHHGSIEVESEVGKGSTFRVCLPIRQEPSAAFVAIPTRPATPSA